MAKGSHVDKAGGGGPAFLDNKIREVSEPAAMWRYPRIVRGSSKVRRMSGG
jgi:hypothetical protein